MKSAHFFPLFILFFIFSGCTNPRKNNQIKEENQEIASADTLKSICPDCVTTVEAASKIGKNVKVIGTVRSVQGVKWEQGKPWFINIDQEFPDIIFNTVIFENDQEKFSFDQISNLKGKKVIVNGLVKQQKFNGNERYKPSEYPQITIKEVKQIQVIE